MSIFNLHSSVVGHYRDFVRSFFTVADDRAREFIDHELLDEARLWPEALLQIRPTPALHPWMTSPLAALFCLKRRRFSAMSAENHFFSTSIKSRRWIMPAAVKVTSLPAGFRS